MPASLRTLRRAGYDRRDPFAVLITMPGPHSNDRTRHGFYNAGMSESAANPGSDADILYGMDRAQALAETGLDSAFPRPVNGVDDCRHRINPEPPRGCVGQAGLTGVVLAAAVGPAASPLPVVARWPACWP